MRRVQHFLTDTVSAVISSLGLVWVVTFGVSSVATTAQASDGIDCLPTGWVVNGVNLTAALISPTGTFSGVLDATGCNIGIYYGPGVNAKLIWRRNLLRSHLQFLKRYQ